MKRNDNQWRINAREYRYVNGVRIVFFNEVKLRGNQRKMTNKTKMENKRESENKRKTESMPQVWHRLWTQWAGLRHAKDHSAPAAWGDPSLCTPRTSLACRWSCFQTSPSTTLETPCFYVWLEWLAHWQKHLSAKTKGKKSNAVLDELEL